MIEIEGHFGSITKLHSLPVRKEEDNPSEVRRLRRKIANNTRPRGDGAIVMEDSGNLLPPPLLRERARLKVPEKHRKAYRRHVESPERGAQQITPEQRFEMRSAFGEGEDVVNPINGNRYTT